MAAHDNIKPYDEKQIAFDKRYLEMALIWQRIHIVKDGR